MGRHKRTFTPRVRTTRPLGVPLSPNKAPATPLAAPVLKEGKWYIEAPLSSRLHQKSALGKTDSEGGCSLTNEEVLFCHWHRHVPLPSDGWFADAVREDPDLVARSVAFDVSRSGGELVVPVTNIPSERYSTHQRRLGLYDGTVNKLSPKRTLSLMFVGRGQPMMLTGPNSNSGLDMSPLKECLLNSSLLMRNWK